MGKERAMSRVGYFTVSHSTDSGQGTEDTRRPVILLQIDTS